MIENKSQTIFWILLIAIVATVAYEVFVANSINYHMSDAYYYIAVAESFMRNGHFSDLTVIPPGAPVTPQNGIVFVHIALIALGVDDPATRLIVVECILLVNLVLILFMLQMIAKRLEIGQIAARLLLVSFALSYYIYAYWVAPLNDGFFASATFGIAVLTLRLNTGQTTQRAGLWAGLIVLAVLIGQFRLQGISVLLAAAAAFLRTNRRLVPAVSFILLSVVSYAAVVTIMVATIQDYSMLRQFTVYGLSKFSIQGLTQWLIILLDDAIPSAFLNFPAARLGDGLFYWVRVVFSMSVLISMLAAIYYYIRKPRFTQIFLLLNVFITIVILFAFQVIDRYFYIAVPILWLLFISHLPQKGNIQVIAASIALLIAIASFGGRLALQDISYVKNQNNLTGFEQAVAGRNIRLISEEPRITYFLFNRPSLISDSDVNSGDYVVVIGQPAFLNQVISRLQSRFETVEIKPMNLKWDLLYSVPGLDSESFLIHVGHE